MDEVISLVTSAVQDSDDETSSPETAILFIVVSLAIGTISRQLLHKTKVPYTVALLLIGMGLGALEYGTHRGLGSFGRSIRLWSNIDPNLILYVFLPALLFESSFSMEIHQIKRCLMQMTLLAGPGVIISTVCLALVHRYIFPYGWSWSVCLLLGGLLSATDPVAIISLLKDLKASKKLSTIIEGESLMNDGTAMVVFELFHQMVLGKHFTAGEIITFLCQVAFGAVGLGLAFGLVSAFWLGIMFNDTVMEITLTFTASYLAFYLAQHEAGVSGVLTVMTVGIFFAAFAKTAFKGESQHSMHCFWTMVAYFANTVIFILSGVVISESILHSHSINQIEGRDWGYLFVLYIALQISRAVVVLLLYPGLSYYGYGLTFREALLLVWAGLRGAVALALSLSVHETQDGQGVPEQTQAKFVFFTGGVVILTLIVNGSTSQFMLRYLQIERTTKTKKLVLEHVKNEMNRRVREGFDELGGDEELGPADWVTVRKYVACLNQFHEEVKPPQPSEPTTSESTTVPSSRESSESRSSSSSDSRKIQLQDTRLRFLNGVQAAYWDMLEEGRITQTAARLLMQSVDEALDKVANNERISDWAGLHPHVHFPAYLKHLQTAEFCLPKKLLTYLIVERLELGCYISAAFLRAHLIVRRHLRAFIGQTEASEVIIKESEDEAVEAKQFLEGIRLSFTEVLRVVKTKQVVHAILVSLSEYIQSLEKSGLLEDKETSHLHDAVQADLKRLLRNPPSVKIPKGLDVLVVQPFVASLPSAVQTLIFSSTREFLKLRGSVLCKEGSRADGVWLIANGIVKWSNHHNARHLLHPTFSHGSTLGLYEVLMGKTNLCNLVADSVVQCFFIEKSKVLHALQRNPELENIFWQESAVAVARIVFPDLLEAMSIHELRVTVKNSTMVSFIRGEVVEISYGETGLLLEGFLKQEGDPDIIGAPAGIMFHKPSDLNFPEVYYGGVFHVETRSRLAIMTLDFHSSSSTSLLARGSSFGGKDSFTLRRREQHTIGCMGLDTAAKIGDETKVRRNSLASQQVRSEWTRGSTGQISAQQVGTDWKRGSTGQILGQQARSSTFLADTGRPAMRRNSQTGHALRRQGSLPFIPVPPRVAPLRTRRRRTQQRDSSESSDAEEECIVQIESPSSLFHHTTFNNGSENI